MRIMSIEANRRGNFRVASLNQHKRRYAVFAIKFCFLRAGAKLPAYQQRGSSKFALHACMADHEELVILSPGATAQLKTGLALEVPKEWTLSIADGHQLGSIRVEPQQLTPGSSSEEITITVYNVSQVACEIRHGDVIAAGELIRQNRSDGDPGVHWAFQLVPALSRAAG